MVGLINTPDWLSGQKSLDPAEENPSAGKRGQPIRGVIFLPCGTEGGNKAKKRFSFCVDQSSQGYLQATAEGFRGSLQGLEGNGLVGWIEQPFEGGTAGIHPTGHLRFGQILFFHHLFHLISNDTLDRQGLGE